MVYRPLLLQVILSLLLFWFSKSFTENFVYLKPFTFDMVGKRISSVAHSQIAFLHEEGYSSREIAGRLSLVQSTVVRSLKMSQRTGNFGYDKPSGRSKCTSELLDNSIVKAAKKSP